MESRAPNLFGRIVAVATGTALFLGIVTYLLWAGQRSTLEAADYYRFIYFNQALYGSTLFLLAIYALCGIGVVIVLEEFIPAPRAILRWVSLLAIIGFAVLAMNSILIRNEANRFASIYLGEKYSYEGFGFRAFVDKAGKLWLDVFPDSPTSRSGVLTGDQVLTVNGDSTEGMTATDLTNRAIRYSQSGLKLTVQTPGQPARDVTIQPGPVNYWGQETQSAMEAIGLPDLDRYYFFSFGLVGVWLIVVNWFSRQNKFFPTALSWIGVAAGILYCLFSLGYFLGIAVIIMVTIIAALILGPLWFIWAGIHLGR